MPQHLGEAFKLLYVRNVYRWYLGRYNKRCCTYPTDLDYIGAARKELKPRIEKDTMDAYWGLRVKRIDHSKIDREVRQLERDVHSIIAAADC